MRAGFMKKLLYPLERGLGCRERPDTVSPIMDPIALTAMTPREINRYILAIAVSFLPFILSFSELFILTRLLTAPEVLTW